MSIILLGCSAKAGTIHVVATPLRTSWANEDYARINQNICIAVAQHPIDIIIEGHNIPDPIVYDDPMEKACANEDYAHMNEKICIQIVNKTVHYIFTE